MPKRMACAIRAVVRTLGYLNKRWTLRLAQAGERLAVGVHQYRSNCLLFLSQNRMSVLQVFLITVLYYLGKLNLAYLILLGLGLQVDYLMAMAILALLRFIIYFSPTPGASGIGDISIATLTSAIMPLYLVPVYTVLYRAFHLFLPAAFGAWVLFSEISTDRSRPATG